jgi:hypothetical protein
VKNKIISGLLLFTFFVLLTPRDWWHECDHKQFSTTTLSESHFDDGSCDICDIDLGFFTVQSILFFRSNKPVLPSEVSAELLDKESTTYLSFSLRGPPQNT